MASELNELKEQVESEIRSEIESLKAARDELRVQAHLGAAEVREAWENAEKNWHNLEGRLKVLGEATQESLDEVGAAAKILAEEVRRGFEHVRKLL